MLTKAAQYAIRSTLYLASKSDKENRINISQIAEDLEVPAPFLAKLLQQLSRANLISSIKGPKGGFYFSDENRENNLWDIIKCIDGTTKFDNCFMGLSSCNDLNPCPVHFTVVPFKKKLMSDFKDKTIKEFSADIQIKGSHILLK